MSQRRGHGGEVVILVASLVFKERGRIKIVIGIMIMRGGKLVGPLEKQPAKSV